MEALEAILTRRSVRKYSGREIPQTELEKLLRAAMSAPSARNEQPWHFVVITKRETLAQIPAFSPYAKMAPSAQAGIVVCGDLSLQKIEDFWVQDCANATMNILLAAHALGLGAVWTAAYPMEDRAEGFRKLLNLPEKVIPLCFIPLGYPAETPEKQDRYQQDRVHYEKW